MEPRILPATNGQPTLAFGGEYLEDPHDPYEGARQLVAPERLAGARVVVLMGAGLGYRVRRLRDLGAESLLVFEPEAEVARLARAHDPETFDGVTLVTAIAPLTEHLLRASTAGQKTVLLVPPAYRRAFPEAHDRLVAAMHEAEALKLLRRNTAVERFGLILESALRNLGRLGSLPLYTQLGRPLQNVPAFIVSAGPSLDRNAHLLPLAARKGAIFTVNTASRAVMEAGARIDVLTCIESLDVTRSMADAARQAGLVALDLSANPANFEVPASRRTVFMPHGDPFLAIAAEIGTGTLGYGASVATASFALAVAWGADPIVLVGQDLAYTNGRVYASHTGREAMRATRQGPGVTIDWPEEMLQSFRANGVREPARTRPAVTLPAWGGEGEVLSTHDMMLFLRWFEAAAHAHADVELVNATEGGASIAGFAERTLADVLERLPHREHGLEEAWQSARPLGAEAIDEMRRTFVRDVRTVGRVARECLEARSARRRRRAERAFAEACKRAKLVEVQCAPELIRLREERGLAPEQRRERTLRAVHEAAQRVLTLLEAA